MPSRPIPTNPTLPRRIPSSPRLKQTESRLTPTSKSGRVGKPSRHSVTEALDIFGCMKFGGCTSLRDQTNFLPLQILDNIKIRYNWNILHKVSTFITRNSFGSVFHSFITRCRGASSQIRVSPDYFLKRLSGENIIKNNYMNYLQVYVQCNLAWSDLDPLVTYFKTFGLQIHVNRTNTPG